MEETLKRVVEFYNRHEEMVEFLVKVSRTIDGVVKEKNQTKASQLETHLTDEEFIIDLKFQFSKNLYKELGRKEKKEAKKQTIHSEEPFSDEQIEEVLENEKNYLSLKFEIEQTEITLFEEIIEPLFNASHFDELSQIYRRLPTTTRKFNLLRRMKASGYDPYSVEKI